MKIGKFEEYKGYVGSIEYDVDDDLLYGKLLNIEDLVNYHSNNIADLKRHYHESVDCYIDFKKEIGKE